MNKDEIKNDILVYSLLILLEENKIFLFIILLGLTKRKISKKEDFNKVNLKNLIK